MLELIGLLEWARGTGLERLVGLKQIGRIGRISKDRVNYIGLEGLAEFSMYGAAGRVESIKKCSIINP